MAGRAPESGRQLAAATADGVPPRHFPPAMAMRRALAMALRRTMGDPLLAGILCLLLAGVGAGLRSGWGAEVATAWASSTWASSGPTAARPTLVSWLEEAGRQLVWGPGPAWALGLSGVGAPLTVVAVWLRGYILGVAVGAALSAPLKLPQALLGLFLPHLLGCAAVLVGSREALRFAGALARAAAGIRPYELPAAFARFVAAGAALALLALWAGVLQLLGMSVRAGS